MRRPARWPATRKAPTASTARPSPARSARAASISPRRSTRRACWSIRRPKARSSRGAPPSSPGPTIIFERAADTPPPPAPPPPPTDRRAISALSAADAYAAALDRDTIAGYREFLAAYPHSDQARRVRAILAVRREAAFWRRTVNADTPRAYWTYCMPIRRARTSPTRAAASPCCRPRSSRRLISGRRLMPISLRRLRTNSFYDERPIYAFDDFGPPPPPPPAPYVYVEDDDWRDLPPPPPPPQIGVLPVLGIAIPMAVGAVGFHDRCHRDGVAPPRSYRRAARAAARAAAAARQHQACRAARRRSRPRRRLPDERLRQASAGHSAGLPAETRPAPPRANRERRRLRPSRRTRRPPPAQHGPAMKPLPVSPMPGLIRPLQPAPPGIAAGAPGAKSPLTPAPHPGAPVPAAPKPAPAPAVHAPPVPAPAVMLPPAPAPAVHAPPGASACRSCSTGASACRSCSTGARPCCSCSAGARACRSCSARRPPPLWPQSRASRRTPGASAPAAPRPAAAPHFTLHRRPPCIRQPRRPRLRRFAQRRLRRAPRRRSVRTRLRGSLRLLAGPVCRPVRNRAGRASVGQAPGLDRLADHGADPRRHRHGQRAPEADPERGLEGRRAAARAPSAPSAIRKTSAAAGTALMIAPCGAGNAVSVGNAAPTEKARSRGEGGLNRPGLSALVQAEFVARVSGERVPGHGLASDLARPASA